MSNVKLENFRTRVRAKRIHGMPQGMYIIEVSFPLDFNKVAAAEDPEGVATEMLKEAFKKVGLG